MWHARKLALVAALVLGTLARPEHQSNAFGFGGFGGFGGGGGGHVDEAHDHDHEDFYESA
jgi:hypothetical protein